MKRISSNTFSVHKKRQIAEYAQQAIKHHFTNPIEDADNILVKSINFFRDETLGESILIQSFLKGLFPRLSYTRQQIGKRLKPYLSEKIEIAAQKNKADFRLIGEILTADRLAKSTKIIEKITMNYEDPTKKLDTKILGNLNKDVTLMCRYNHQVYTFEADIKAGNNANNPFFNVIASVPLTSEMKSYSITNNNAVDLHDIQIIRSEQFAKLLKDNKLYETFNEISSQIQYVVDLPIDIIQKNILIQEQLFRAISLGLSIRLPSFYAAHIVPYANILHEKFFEKLHTHINANIFDNKKTFNIFMKQALIAYNQSVQEIASNVKQNKNLLRESGLSEIADDIFN